MTRRFILSRKSFVALASPTRLRIIKILGERRMTLSEISREMNMSKSTVSEHMEKLLKAGLITVEKRGKWTYYSLTDFGRAIADGRELVVRIVISAGIILLSAGLILMHERSKPGVILTSDVSSPSQSTAIGDLLPVLAAIIGIVLILLGLKSDRCKWNES